MDGVASKAGRALAAGLAVGAAALGALAVASVKSASDAQQSLGATETVFGKFADKVVADSNRAATQFGLSANEYRENANLLGSLFANQGVASDQLAGKTKAMIGQASDLAATFGGTTKDAVEALGSAFKGEFDPLERYGISIKQSTINAELAARGQDNLTGAALKQAQQIATTDLIMKQSAKTRGAFARESDTLAHQQQVLSAQFDNLKVVIGSALLPVLTKVLTFVNANMIPAFNAVRDVLSPVINRVREFFSGLGSGSGQMSGLTAFITSSVLPAFRSIGSALMNLYAVVVPIIRQVVEAIRANWSTIRPMVANIFNSIKSTIMSALSIVKSYITIVTKTIQVIWRNFGSQILSFITNTMKNMAALIQGVMKVISGIFKTVSSVLKGDWKGAWDGIKSILSGAVSIIKALISQLFNVIKTLASAGLTVLRGLWSKAWDGIKAAVSSGISAVMGLIRGIPGLITGALSGLGSLLVNAGRDIIQGLINGIDSMIGSVTSKLKDLTDLIPKVKGPPKRDKTLLTPAGRMIIRGLIKGFDDGRKGVKDSLGDITDLIRKHFDKNKDFAQKAIKSLANETKALIRNADKRVKVYKKLEDAQKKLLDLQKASADYAKNVKTGVINYTNVTGLGAAFNADALVASLKARLEKVRQFSALISQLVASGLNQTAVDQLVQAGVEGGLATAQAIADGGSEAITQFNDLQKEIDKAATGLGNTAADSMYAAGIKVAEGAVAGFKKQKKELEKIGRELGEDLALAVQRALNGNFKDPKRGGGKDRNRNLNVNTKGNNSKGNSNRTYNITVTAPANVDKRATAREIKAMLVELEKTEKGRAYAN